MKKIILNLLVASFLSTQLFAEGGMASGGGKGLVCFDNDKSVSILLKNNGKVDDDQIDQIGALITLDLQIAFMQNGAEFGTSAKLDLPQDDETLKDYLTRLINKLVIKYPKIGKAVQLHRKEFQENIYWRINPVLQMFDELDVSDHTSKYCSLTTFATQYDYLGKTFIHIDQRLFYHPKNSIESQAILLLHEYIYAVMRRGNLTNSRPVRHIIASILKL